MKKKTEIKIKLDTMIDGELIEGGTVVATVKSCCDVGTLSSLIRANAVELVADGDDEPEAQADEPEADETELEPIETVEVEEVQPAEAKPENELAELMAAGLDENLAERLVFNGLKTPDDVRAYVAAGNDLVDLDKIGDGYAKKIAKALGIQSK